MWKYFTTNETRKWIDIVQQLVYDYNGMFHSTVKMSPVEASKPENYAAVWNHIIRGVFNCYEYEVPKYKVDQTVRISKCKSVFDKGYLPNFTEEFF